MRKTGFAIAVVLVLVSSHSAHAQDTQMLPPVSYGTFMRQDHEGRLRTINRTTPEVRASLVREHIHRWINVNRSWLTPEQLNVLKGFIALVTPGRYQFPVDPDTLARGNELTARAKALFSTAEMRQALVIFEADYIPWQW